VTVYFIFSVFFPLICCLWLHAVDYAGYTSSFSSVLSRRHYQSFLEQPYCLLSYKILYSWSATRGQARGTHPLPPKKKLVGWATLCSEMFIWMNEYFFGRQYFWRGVAVSSTSTQNTPGDGLETTIAVSRSQSRRASSWSCSWSRTLMSGFHHCVAVLLPVAVSPFPLATAVSVHRCRCRCRSCVSFCCLRL